MAWARSPGRSKLETALVLGRAGVLPTIWSNVLAGCWLGGGCSLFGVGLLLVGVSLFHFGALFLHDAFDADLDRLHRRGRPIPSGDISIDTVWQWGFGTLGLGTVLLVLMGGGVGAWTALLLVTVLFHHGVHKVTGFAPLLVGVCRMLLYLLSAAAGFRGVDGQSIWPAIALGLYVTGMGYFERHGRSRRALPRWPVALLLMPLLLALVTQGGVDRLGGLLLVVAVGLWLLRCLQPTFMSQTANVARTVSGLRSGIVLVDLLAVGVGGFPALAGVLVVLFGLSLVWERWLPDE